MAFVSQSESAELRSKVVTNEDISGCHVTMKEFLLLEKILGKGRDGMLSLYLQPLYCFLSLNSLVHIILLRTGKGSQYLSQDVAVSIMHSLHSCHSTQF